ncbi:SRPBCC family protein [Enterococcus sp. BWB1-3]|uniref:SRPBCC family protein n=1 Tax=unclassified Enterococcus TaxID=2608891 RepID=UPI001923D681|nr:MULTISPECIES: SRPBCC family protein [unclassified Enterococcus]MBL1229586.1 SRPBCC family protein [Enterococcus sp. BWB1-3]MCB5950723.1 SRPBCC family protein [Enterococcus sp. BWT-B8]MCB5955962.1 SRPBCC family protein [Enterococcus sp. CWB-B31]
MISWKKEIIIPVNIEIIWTLFDIENMKRIMPQVIETKVLEKTDGIVGSTYEQTYQEGKRVEKYIVTDLEHEDTPERKHNKSGFTLAKMFEIETSFTLIKISENETKFLYSGQNKGTNFIARCMVKMMGNKKNEQVVTDFMERVKTEALKDKTGGK